MWLLWGSLESGSGHWNTNQSAGVCTLFEIYAAIFMLLSGTDWRCWWISWILMVCVTKNIFPIINLHVHLPQSHLISWSICSWNFRLFCASSTALQRHCTCFITVSSVSLDWSVDKVNIVNDVFLFLLLIRCRFTVHISNMQHVARQGSCSDFKCPYLRFHYWNENQININKTI